MARIVATGIAEKLKPLGEIRVIIEGGEVEIEKTTFERKVNGKWEYDFRVETVFDVDMKNGPHYPLCAEPETMRRALFILLEWFGEAESCWVKEPKHVKVEGEIEPMPSEPGAIY